MFSIIVITTVINLFDEGDMSQEAAVNTRVNSHLEIWSCFQGFSASK